MEWIQAHPNWSGLFVLVVSALESFLVVGLFVPGTIVMFGIGAMIAAGSMELLPTLLWAAVGAVIGDGTSYFIGRFYHQHLRVIWPFRKYPQMIGRGVDFFHRHGGKSVILARFVGPVRPLVPAVAGMLNMFRRALFPGQHFVRLAVGARLYHTRRAVRGFAGHCRGNRRTAGTLTRYPADITMVFLVVGTPPVTLAATARQGGTARHTGLVAAAPRH